MLLLLLLSSLYRSGRRRALGPTRPAPTPGARRRRRSRASLSGVIICSMYFLLSGLLVSGLYSALTSLNFFQTILNMRCFRCASGRYHLLYQMRRRTSLFIISDTLPDVIIHLIRYCGRTHKQKIKKTRNKTRNCKTMFTKDKIKQQTIKS